MKINRGWLKGMEKNIIKKQRHKKPSTKRIVTVLLSLALLFAVLATIIHFTTRLTNDSYADCAVGDVNGDGKIDSADSILTLEYIIGEEKLFENQIKNADVNCDGEINTEDTLLILRYSIGEISSIPYDEQKERLLDSSDRRKLTVNANNMTATAQIVNEWDNNDGSFSYQVNLIVRNDSDKSTGSWRATVGFDKEIVSLTKSWECNPLTSGQSITLGGSDIDAGDTATCGFIITAQKDAAITKLTVR